jgi:hypothetical protein
MKRGAGRCRENNREAGTHRSCLERYPYGSISQIKKEMYPGDTGVRDKGRQAERDRLKVIRLKAIRLGLQLSPYILLLQLLRIS